MRVWLIGLMVLWSLAALAQPSHSDCQERQSVAAMFYEDAQFEQVCTALDECYKAGMLSARSALLLYRAYNALGKDEEAEAVRQFARREKLGELKNARLEKKQETGLIERYQSALESMALARSELDAYPEKTALLLESLIDSTRLGRSLKVEALELLAEAYLKLEQPQKADTTFRRIYPLSPQYEPGSNRSLNYRQFARRYVSEPRYSFGISGGLHGMQPYSTKVFSVPDVQIDEETYRARYALHFGLQFAYRPKGLNRLKEKEESAYRSERKINWEFLFGLGYSWDSYDYEGQYSNVLGPSSQRQGANVSFREKQERFNLSAMMVAVLPNPWAGKWKKRRLANPEVPPLEGDRLLPQILRRLEPYAGAGFGIHRLDKATLKEPAILYAQDGAFIDDDIVLASRGLLGGKLKSDAGPAQRADYLFSFQGRLGVKYRINRTYYFVEGGYAWTPVNMVATDARGANSTLVEDFHYLDSDLRQHHLGFSVGIGHSIYYTIWK